MLHGAVHAVFAPIGLQVSRPRHLDERCFQVPKQLAVPLVSHHGLEFGNSRNWPANEGRLAGRLMLSSSCSTKNRARLIRFSRI